MPKAKKTKKRASKKAQLQANILGIKVSSTTKQRVLRMVRDKLNKKSKFYIVTPNPEIVLRASKDSNYKRIINSADLVIPDGIGLAAANKFINLPNPEKGLKKAFTLFVQGMGVGFSVLFDRSWIMEDLQIIRGRELFIDLIQLANKKAWKVFLLGDRKGSAQDAEAELKLSYKKVKIFSALGPNVDLDAKPRTKKDKQVQELAIKRINEVKPHLLFIAFGPPKQEKWLDKHYSQLDFNGAMCVGITFDYVSGRVSLPPSWIAENSLEWIWRLFTGSTQARRIFSAVIEFSIEVFNEKWRN